jgi:TPR repeat protein
MKSTGYSVLVLLALLGLVATPARAEITDCDRIASHPSDPDKVLPGFERKDIDLPKAEAVCRAVIAQDDRRARAHYLLGRVLYYQKKTPAAILELERAAALGYRQAIFVLGYVLYDGTQAPRDDCRAAQLWQQSIALEHPWTGAYLVEGYLDGRFKACGLKLTDDDLQRYLSISTSKIPYGESEGRMESATRKLQARRDALAAAAMPAEVVVPFDPSKYSQVPTECDRLASHGDDPYHVAPGLEKPQMDLPRAIDACRAAVKADPANPRLNYLLGRTLGYSGRGAEGLANREAAIAANYPQALFVIGYMSLTGMNQQPKDVCRGAELIRRSAQQNRIAGQLGFVYYVLRGDFKDCKVRKDKQEMLGFLAAARKVAQGDYYQNLLADKLEEDLRALP